MNPDALCMAFGSCNGHEFAQYLWLVGMYTGIPMPYGLCQDRACLQYRGPLLLLPRYVDLPHKYRKGCCSLSSRTEHELDSLRRQRWRHSYATGVVLTNWCPGSRRRVPLKMVCRCMCGQCCTLYSLSIVFTEALRSGASIEVHAHFFQLISASRRVRFPLLGREGRGWSKKAVRGLKNSASSWITAPLRTASVNTMKRLCEVRHGPHRSIHAINKGDLV